MQFVLSIYTNNIYSKIFEVSDGLQLASEVLKEAYRKLLTNVTTLTETKTQIRRKSFSISLSFKSVLIWKEIFAAYTIVLDYPCRNNQCLELYFPKTHFLLILLFAELVLMKIGFIERTHSLLLKIFLPFSPRSKEREDINLNKIINQDDGITEGSIIAHTNIVTDV